MHSAGGNGLGLRASLICFQWVQVASGDCPHTLFYGSPGVGKKTLILAMLRQIYGPSVERLKVHTRTPSLRSIVHLVPL